MNYEGIYREKEGATGLIKRPRKLWLTVSTVREIGRLQRSIRVLAWMTNAIWILRTNCFDLFDETAADFPPVHRINSIHCFTEILSPLYLCTLIRYCFTFYLGPFLLFHLSLFSSFRSSISAVSSIVGIRDAANESDRNEIQNVRCRDLCSRIIAKKANNFDNCDIWRVVGGQEVSGLITELVKIWGARVTADWNHEERRNEAEEGAIQFQREQ